MPTLSPTRKRPPPQRTKGMKSRSVSSSSQTSASAGVIAVQARVANGEAGLAEDADRGREPEVPLRDDGQKERRPLQSSS